MSTKYRVFHVLYLSPFFFKKPVKSGVPILDKAEAPPAAARPPVRLFGDVGIGVPTEIRCGFVELALVMVEGVEPFEVFFEWPPAGPLAYIPRAVGGLTHETAETTARLVCHLIEVLGRGAPTRVSA